MSAAPSTPENPDSAELLEGQNRVLELIAQGAGLPAVLDSLLGVIQSQCPGMLCSILLLDPVGMHVRHGAARDLPEAFISRIDGEPVGPRAGSCGTAAYLRQPVIVEDIATDPLWEDYREIALQHDLRACWSTPILDARQHVLGTFAMYFRAPGRPEARHLRLIEISTHIAAIAIAHHQRTEALRVSEERLRLALTGGNVDIWEYDPSTSRLAWFGGLKAVWGGPPEAGSLAVEFLVDTVYPPDQDKVRMAFAHELACESGRDTEFRVRYADGSLHWYVLRGRPDYDSAGRAVLMRGIALEITERKQADEEIRRRDTQLVEAQRIAHLGSYEWDVTTNMVRRSDELCRIFGLSPDEFEPTYEGYLARVHPEDRPTTKAIIDRSFASKQPFDFEERIIRPDGRERVLHSQGQWILDENRVPTKLVGICQDITGRKESERQLRTTNAALDEEIKERTRAGKEIQALAGRLIHAQEEERTRLARELHDDFSQQIATLSIAASNLKKHIPKDATEARTQSERMQQKLIDLAESVRKFSHNLHPAMLEYAGLSAALKDYCVEFGMLSGIAVSFRAEGTFEGLPSDVVLCLYRSTQEALQNVLKHAQVRRAQVTIGRTTETVRLIVSDQGVGMDTHTATSGLGLVNLRERTRLVNGALKIESSPHQGTTVTITVPIADNV